MKQFVRYGVATALLMLIGSQQSAATGTGVVVESIPKGDEREAAGIAAGDVLFSWERVDSVPGEVNGGELSTPFEFARVLREQLLRVPIVLRGRRAGQPLTLTVQPQAVPPHMWRMEFRLAFEGEVLASYERGRELLANGDAKEGARLWREIAASAEKDGDWRLASWLLVKLGGTLTAKKAWADALEAFDASLAVSRDPGDQGIIEFNRARVFEGQLDYVKGMQAFDRAIELQRLVQSESMTIAFYLSDSGWSAFVRSDLDEAELRFREALAMRQRLVPKSWLTAASLSNLGMLAQERGDLAAAEALYQQSLDLLAEIGHQGLMPAGALHNLARLARTRGDLSRAERLLAQALAIDDRYGSPGGSENGATILHDFGRVAIDQKDFERAETFFERALAIYERLAPHRMPMGLMSLGLVARERRDFEAAERYHERALELARKVNPRGRDAAVAMNDLAAVAFDRGDPARAETLVRQALDIHESLIPRHMDTSFALEQVGRILTATGRWDEAETALRRCLDIRRELGPGTLFEASALHHLARLATRKGEKAKAAELYGQAMDVLDRQSLQVGNSHEVRIAFGGGFGDVYGEAIALLLDQERRAEAFHVLERSRARSFLALLAERDLVDADVPEEIDRRRRRLDRDYDRTQASLAGLDVAKDEARARELTSRLRDLRAQQAEIRDELRRLSPRVAALRHPEPLDVVGAQGTLDPGTVLLSYSVGDDRTDLFVVAKERDLRVFQIPLGRKALEEKVQAFRDHVARARVADVPALEAEAAALYDALLRPAEDALAKAERILLSPDGPLHTLPFAALRRNGRYLVEWKPLHLVASATVYAELGKAPQSGESEGRVSAFGDPRYPLRAAAGGEAMRDAGLRGVLRPGLGFTALPESRREAELIAGLYGDRGRSYVGDAATEEHAKREARGSRYLHFACHGFLDERIPLNSALALTIPDAPKEGQDNGLLQAWEIFERVRVDADLVTLSACDTGLGKDMGGEGLIGLTRAFQYAGARSVVASLWSAPDRSTVDLMRTFYKGLRRGLDKDEALRQAQIDAVRQGGVRSRPFRWAGFQLFGRFR